MCARVFLLLFCVMPACGSAQIVRITSVVDGEDGFSTGFFVDETTIVCADHAVSLEEKVKLHTLALLDDQTIGLKELGEATCIYESETDKSMDDVAILRFSGKHNKKLAFSGPINPIGMEMISPSYPMGIPSVNYYIGRAALTTSLGEVIEAYSIKGTRCVGGCSGSPVLAKESGKVIGMISRAREEYWLGVIIPTSVIKKHLQKCFPSENKSQEPSIPKIKISPGIENKKPD